MEREVTTNRTLDWKYETDEKTGICVIAKDKMTIKFRFECTGDKFFDVLKIDEVIDALLKKPVSVEGIVVDLAIVFQGMKITGMGRAESHGWITVTAGDK